MWTNTANEATHETLTALRGDHQWCLMELIRIQQMQGYPGTFVVGTRLTFDASPGFGTGGLSWHIADREKPGDGESIVDGMVTG